MATHEEPPLMDERMPDMAKRFRMGPARKIGNVLITALIRLGVAPSSNHLLTTRGRKSGAARTNPVQIVEDRGKRWLVAPYGEVAWVKNARAAGYVTLSRGRRSQDYSIAPAAPKDAARVLKLYVRKAPIVLPYFEAGKNSSLEDFEEEVHLHPVFELTPRA